MQLSQFLERGGPLIMEWGMLDIGGVTGLDAYASVAYEFGIRKAG
jgi:hypothetical protein